MERTRFINHKGAKILFLDFSGLADPEEAVKAISDAKAIVVSQPEKSLLTLTDVAGVSTDATIVQALWELLRHNKPYVRAGAVVGIAGDQQDDLYQLLTHQARREVPAFTDIEEAKEWLVGQ